MATATVEQKTVKTYVLEMNEDEARMIRRALGTLTIEPVSDAVREALASVGVRWAG